MAFLSIVILVALIWVFIGILLVMFAGTFILEIFLSKMKNPWTGLILPGITFGFIFLLGTMAPDFSTFLLLFGKGNIPTVLYLLIYFFIRRGKKKAGSASQEKTGHGRK